jgi:hypothetical protein
MASSVMLNRVDLVRMVVSEKLSASIIRVTKIGELRTLAATSNRRTLVMANVFSKFTGSCRPDDGGATFLRNIDSYKSHTP